MIKLYYFLENRYLLLFLTFSLTFSSPFHSQAQISLPVSYNFDTASDTLGWTHYASDTTRTDPWQWGMPSGRYLDTAHSAPYAWGTILDGLAVNNTFSYLESPEFNLSATDTSWYLSFYHTRHLGTNYGVRVDYSLDQGQTWTLLNEARQKKKNWYYDYRGWTSDKYNSFLHSTHSLEFLQGNPSVKFRFLFRGNSNKEGFVMDDFAILEEYANLSVIRHDTVSGLSQNFRQVPVPYSYYHSSPFEDAESANARFYFSEDKILDPGDQFLDSLRIVFGRTRGYTYELDIQLPASLSSGEYFMIYELDSEDTYLEDNEQDNIGFSHIIIDSTYVVPYVSSFEGNQQEWKDYSDRFGVEYWKRGDPNGFQMEQPRFGKNAWYQHPDTASSYRFDHLESPYLDLSNSTNTSICFWYRLFSERKRFDPYTLFKIHVPYLAPVDFVEFFATNQQYRVIPQRPGLGWDCTCIDLSEFDGSTYTKFRILWETRSVVTDRAYKYKFISIDDVYVGPAKPDVSIDGAKQNLFSPSSRSSDTLSYVIFNSGLAQLPPTSTEFYWSTDTVLDNSDIALGSQAEISMSDTSFLERFFIYTKPTTAAGTYYILHKVDASNQVNEMREYDNIGYFKLHQDVLVDLPYSNDFETQVDGWYHEATLGSDEWSWGEPSGGAYEAFSGTKAWLTNDTGLVSQDSRMHLYTPVFDFTSIDDPVMSFDMKFVRGNSADKEGINLSYSTDGGRHWEVLDTTSFSFYHWYYFYQYESNSGQDYIDGPVLLSNMLYRSEPIFLFNDWYESRDGSRMDMYILDIGFLAGKEAVQFRFNYFNQDKTTEGALIDNFEILDKYTDLWVEEQKTLSTSSLTDHVRFSMNITNTGNYLADSTEVVFYLSQDTVIDGTDYILGVERTGVLRPKMRHYFNLNYDSIPQALGQYSYLIYEIDPLGQLAESDETNNVGYWGLGMDEAVDLPYYNDFEEEVIGDWVWYRDHKDDYIRDHRFRHRPIELHAKRHTYYTDWEEGFWRIDFINPQVSTRFVPMHYLETPLFDFSNEDSLYIKFLYSFRNSVSNMDYSLDGGESWQVLGDQVVYDSLGVNWYTLGLSNLLRGQPYFYPNGFFVKLRTARYNISFLAGQPAVRFRFKYRHVEGGYSSGPFPFYMDKFTILQSLRLEPDLVPEEIAPRINVDQRDSSFMYSYELSNQGCVEVDSSFTQLYWSKDSLLDVNVDLLLHSLREPAMDEFISNKNELEIVYPMPITQQKYWLILSADAGSEVQEISESNNLAKTCIEFSNFANSLDLHTLEGFDLQAHLTALSMDVYIRGEGLKGPVQIKVFDLQGREVFATDPMPAFKGKKTFLLKKPLGNSVYILKLFDIGLPGTATQKLLTQSR